jgi:hypothetical protein
MKDNLLNEALKASSEGKIEEWIHSFLYTSGRNVVLSDGLKKDNRYWVGPLEIDLSLLTRIQGPTDEANKNEIEEKWSNRVSPMITDLSAGWQPAPLIAEYKEENLIIRDGGHRLYALKKAGYLKYWVIIWANSEEEYVKVQKIVSR